MSASLSAFCSRAPQSASLIRASLWVLVGVIIGALLYKFALSSLTKVILQWEFMHATEREIRNGAFARYWTYYRVVWLCMPQVLLAVLVGFITPLILRKQSMFVAMGISAQVFVGPLLDYHIVQRLLLGKTVYASHVFVCTVQIVTYSAIVLVLTYCLQKVQIRLFGRSINNTVSSDSGRAKDSISTTGGRK
jgi:magnesium-transporting ATPase (P-type)